MTTASLYATILVSSKSTPATLLACRRLLQDSQRLNASGASPTTEPAMTESESVETSGTISLPTESPKPSDTLGPVEPVIPESSPTSGRKRRGSSAQG